MASDAALNRLALETSTAQQARRAALQTLLQDSGPYAIKDYVDKPLTAYSRNLNQDIIEQYFNETKERIPKGREMYRAPSMGEVQSRLPRTSGSTYRPGVVTSTGGSFDLQALGELFSKSSMGTGGNQSYAPGLAKITAMTDLPGIENINDFLEKNKFQTRSLFNNESLIGPKVRFTIQDFMEGKGGNPPTWNLGAYANMGLGAANILGFLPMLHQAGRIAQGKDTSMGPQDPTIGQMR